MTTLTQERKRIRKLVKQNQTNRNQVANFYTSAMRIISENLNEFYLEYADNTGLNLSQVAGQVSAWDTVQFQKAVDRLLQDIQPDDKLSQKLQLAYLQATQTKRDMLNALISAGVAVATYQVAQHGQTQGVHEYREGHQVRTGKLPIKVPEHVKASEDYTSRLWAHSDVATARMQQQLNNSLRQGLDSKAMRQLTKVVPHDGPRPDNNLSTELNKVVSRVQGLVVDHTTAANNEAQLTAMHEQDVEYVYFLTQNDNLVCDICDSLVGIHPIDEAPNITDDTHPGCRCQLVPCDKDGNILPGFLW